MVRTNAGTVSRGLCFHHLGREKAAPFGARDFSGTRTLYYHHNEQQICFCTAINPLFSLPFVHKEINETWLAEFLAISGVFEPPDVSTTIYKNILQLPPSHKIIIKNDNVSVSRYHSLSDVIPLQLASSEEYEEAFREVFNKAVTARLRRTKRNVGAHLSGGLDSGSVVSFAARALEHENRSLHTFSYVPETGFVDWTPKHRLADERPLIKQTVQFVGNINDHYLDFSGRSAFTEIDDWLDILESPYKFLIIRFGFEEFTSMLNNETSGSCLMGPEEITASLGDLRSNITPNSLRTSSGFS